MAQEDSCWPEARVQPHVGFMIEVVLGQVFLQVFLFSLALIIQQVLHIHASITDTIQCQQL